MKSKIQDLPKKNRGIWLIGGTTESIKGSKLSSNQQVLQRLFHHHKIQSKTIPTSVSAIMKEVVQLWDKASIPTRKDYHIMAKIKEIHSKFIYIKKSASRRTNKQKEKERQLIESLHDLFDIALSDALTMITLPEDREFLLAQREKGNRGTVGPVDMVQAQKEEIHRKQSLKRDIIREKETKGMQELSGILELSSSSNSEPEIGIYLEDDFGLPRTSLPTQQKLGRPRNVVSLGLVAALDRTKVCDRSSAYIIAAAAESFGHSHSSLSINKESIIRARRKHYELAVKEIHTSFDTSYPITLP